MEIFSFNGKKTTILESLSDVNKNSLTWIRFVDRTDEKIESLSSFTGIPAEEFKDFYSFEERSRLEQGKFLELIYQVPVVSSGEIKTTPINIFIVNNMFITVERENVSPISKTASLLKQGKLKFLFKKSIGHFLYYFLDKINDSFLTSIDKIANITDILEAKGINVSDKQLTTLYNYNETLTRFNQALLGNLEVLSGLKKSYFRKFTKVDLEYFSDLYYEKLQILDTDKIQREVITNLFNYQTVIMSHNLNLFMKRLTSLTLIIVIPTFITGLFGMNYALPFQNYPHAFSYIFGFMILFAVVLYFILRKIGWL